LQSGPNRRLLSFGESAQASAKASAGGSASVVIETNAGTASSFAKATINVKGGVHLQKSNPHHLAVDQHQAKAALLRKKNIQAGAITEQEDVVSTPSFKA